MYPGILRLDHVPHHSSYASCATSFKLCFIPYLASSEQFIVVKLLLLLLDHDAHGGGTPGLVIGISSVRHCCTIVTVTSKHYVQRHLNMRTMVAELFLPSFADGRNESLRRSEARPTVGVTS